MHRLLRAVLLSTVLLWGLMGLAVAQATFGTITGRVTDASGAVLPGVTVAVTHDATNLTRTAVTDEQGTYAVTHLNAGVYTVTVELEGFREASYPDVRLDALATVRIDVRLEVGELVETVVVDAAAPVVETDVPALSSVRDNRALTDLRGGAASYQWTYLAPTGTQGGGSARSFGGGRMTMNNFNVDGISAKSPAFGNELGLAQPMREAVQELRFEYANSRAEFGHIANITMISRSGSNQFRGSGFWNTYPTGLLARDFFAEERPDLRGDNVFGGSLGGPIVRNRAFFFVGYETNLFRPQTVLASNVPTVKMRQGDFSDVPVVITDPQTGEPFPGNVIPPDRLNAGALAWQDRFYPLPNFGSPDLAAGNLRGTFAPDDRLDQIDTRIDYHLAPDQMLYGRFAVTNAPRQLLGDLPPESAGFGEQRARGYQGTASYTWTLSSRLINEAKFGFTRRNSSSGGRPFDAQQVIDLVGIQGLPNVPGLQDIPTINISGITEVPQTLGEFSEWSYQFINTLTYHTGRHLWKAGVQFKPLGSTSRLFPNLGEYNFTSQFTAHAYADFLLGLPETTVRTINRPEVQRRARQLSLFVQDDFTVSPRLTLNYGVRWQFDRPAFERDNLVSNFDPTIGALVVPDASALEAVHPNFPSTVPIVTAADAGLPSRSLRESDRNNFAPRVGFAFRPFEHTRTAIRAGYGVFYEDLSISVADPIFRRGPYGLTERFINRLGDDGTPEFTLQQPFREAGTAEGIQLDGVSRDLVNPYVQQWHLTVEQDVGLRTSLRLSYLGTKGTNLTFQRNVNQPLPSAEPFSPERLPFPGLGVDQILLRDTGANSLYNAMTLEVQRRMHAGLEFMAAWTWAKNLTDSRDVGSEGGAQSENAHDLRRQRGNEPSTPRHRLVSSLIWELPVGEGRRYLNRSGLANQVLGGWQLSALYLAQTGLYLTPSFSGADPSNTGTFGGVPDRLCDGNLSRGERTIERWFDAACFVTPANGRFGNSGFGILRGPDRHVVNLGLFKSFRMPNGHALRFEMTAANAINHTNFNDPALNVSAPGSVSRITATYTRSDFSGPREIMIGLRYQF
ncbi:MAG: hypothetical protein GEU99_12320 [Luteitalea sp.]|nr:hypothetical protein [Luteitalea sp.]